MKNIILIGMPGTGKSVEGPAQAPPKNYPLVDVDDLIKSPTPPTHKAT